MTKKNIWTLIIIIVVIILAVFSLYTRKLNISQPANSTNESDKQFDQAMASDTTTSISTNINSINVDDTSTTDLNEVDKELQKL